MSISFNKVIVHILDLSMGHELTSHNMCVLSDETEALITKHINSLLEGNIASDAVFKQESEVGELIKGYAGDKFQYISREIADRFFRYMCNYELIHSGDLVVAEFIRNGESYLGILKLNYKEEFTHFIEHDGEGTIAQVIKHKSIFATKGIEEAVVINLDNFGLIVLDQSREKYMVHLLDIEQELSTKQKLMTVEHVVIEAIEEHFSNTVQAITEFKSQVSDSIFESSAVVVEDVIRETFKDYENVADECLSRLDECGMKEEKIIVSNMKEAKKYSTHKLKTNTGVEIKLPTDMVKNDNFMEFINNPDGTITIQIKNIGQIINK